MTAFQCSKDIAGRYESASSQNTVHDGETLFEGYQKSTLRGSTASSGFVYVGIG